MATRKIKFEIGNYYHVYNRGVDKRDIISDPHDELRFLHSLNIFNTTESVGSVLEYNKRNKKGGNPVSTSRLVEIIAFNLLGNHYHLVLRQLIDGGISQFMKSLGGGYTKYFNEKHDRSGSLFQGAFKATFIPEENLEKFVAYTNLNHVVHKVGTPTSNWGRRSSWEQYNNKAHGIVEINRTNIFDKNNSIEIVDAIIKEREELDDND
jgi:REP element-mobilizing transposase RayT